MLTKKKLNCQPVELSFLFFFRLFTVFLFHNFFVYVIEQNDVHYKNTNNHNRIENRASAYHIIENTIRRSVVIHKEHIVVIDDYIHNIRNNSEAKQHAECYRHVLLLHARHTGNSYV